MQNAPNIQYTPTETKKNVGPLLGKVLISLSSVREDAKQNPIRKKRQFQETFTKQKVLSLAFQSVNDRKSISTLKCIFLFPEICCYGAESYFREDIGKFPMPVPKNQLL